MAMRPTFYKEMGAGRWRPQTNPVRTHVVIHDSEQAEDINQADDADQLVTALSRPGIAGYHAVADCLPAGYIQVAPWSARVNGAPPLNEEALHICMPERVAYTREQWIRSGYIQIVAQFLKDANETYGIPLVRVRPAELRAGKRGYCGHVDVTETWHQTTHTDPGNNFPWDLLALCLFPTPGPSPYPDDEDEGVIDMEHPVVWSDEGQINNILYVGGGRCYHFNNNESFGICKAKYGQEIHPTVAVRGMKPLGAV